jgi:hypothetical protein
MLGIACTVWEGSTPLDQIARTAEFACSPEAPQIIRRQTAAVTAQAERAACLDFMMGEGR